MLLEKMCVIADPAHILREQDYNSLVESNDYVAAWYDIKRKYKISTNMGAKDINCYDNKTLSLVSNNPFPKIIPNTINTESGLLVGIEFKDLKKLNPNITAQDLSKAFVIKCEKFALGMDEDDEAEYIDGYVVFENENYDQYDKDSHKNVSYEVCWEGAKEIVEEVEENQNSESSEENNE